MIGKQYITMTQQELDKLPDYSCSVPTGVFVGKQWKRRVNYMDEARGWILGEYVKPELPFYPGDYKIKWTAIKIVEEKWPGL